MKPKHHYCKTWRANILFFIGWKPEDVAKFCGKGFDKDLGGKGGSVWAHRRDGINDYYLWTLKKPTNPHTKGVLAHEINHCVSFIFSDRGVVADWINDEPASYLVAELTEVAYG